MELERFESNLGIAVDHLSSQWLQGVEISKCMSPSLNRSHSIIIQWLIFQRCGNQVSV